jgi:hypothetical protein
LKASRAWNVVSQIFENMVECSAHPALFCLIFCDIVAAI